MDSLIPTSIINRPLTVADIVACYKALQQQRAVILPDEYQYRVVIAPGAARMLFALRPMAEKKIARAARMLRAKYG